MPWIRRLSSPIALVALLSTGVWARAAADPPGRIGRMSYLGGAVSFRADSNDDWAAATLNYPVTTGDELWSDSGARAEVHVGSSVVRLAPETQTDFVEVSDRATRIRLVRGSLYLRVRQLERGDGYEVDTPNGTVSLLDPGHYRIDVLPSGERSTVTVRDGDAEVTAGSGTRVPVRPGESVTITGGSSPGSEVVTVTLDDWERWCQARDRQEDASLSLRYVSPGFVGFEALDGYGTWEADATLGAIWVPTVSAGWAPYRSGYWSWVDPWGWTWIDDAPWGFAPFHYGRWTFRRSRWAWVPGEIVPAPVYAPALVAFAGGSGFDLSLSFGAGGGVAWFPLAPGEVFVPAYRVSRTYVRDVNSTSVKITNVDVTRIDVTRVRYANRSVPGAVTAVPTEAFRSGAPVAKAAVRVPASALTRATVIGTSAPVAPRPESRPPRVSARGVARPPAATTRPAITAPTRPRARAAASVERPPQNTTKVSAGAWNGPDDAAQRGQWRTERDQALARQAAERAELERRQQAELSTPPAGVSMDDLRRSQAQEQQAQAQRHRAETEAIDRRYRGRRS
jgi:uncharacterized protein DUF6600/FecR-like protein